MNVAAGAVGTVEKPERFLRRLFQAAVEMIKKKSPKATLIHFHGGGSLHSAFRPACFFHKGAIQSLENGHPLHRVWVRSSCMDDSRGTNVVGGPVLTLSNR
jgi:hypothetical protein